MNDGDDAQMKPKGKGCKIILKYQIRMLSEGLNRLGVTRGPVCVCVYSEESSKKKKI